MYFGTKNSNIDILHLLYSDLMSYLLWVFIVNTIPKLWVDRKFYKVCLFDGSIENSIKYAFLMGQ